MKKVIFLFSDRKILFGIGIGLVLGVTFMFVYEYNISISDSQIEEKARNLGMHYSNECKAYSIK
ncbi:hypothetical protein SAMN05421842_10668 [Clostridium uliginosum]|uniref:Uncharacterized protein n=1 Tax=Clostridium uliginosum TaxID=119641 RepID=A0A1I1KLK3_9CLOT|nr:hypothetical protein SAMN05421842_10668 [Clostridium uliginosum]